LNQIKCIILLLASTGHRLGATLVRFVWRTFNWINGTKTARYERSSRRDNYHSKSVHFQSEYI